MAKGLGLIVAGTLIFLIFGVVEVPQEMLPISFGLMALGIGLVVYGAIKFRKDRKAKKQPTN